MAVSPNPNYRNNRKYFYTEKTTDTLCVGTVVQILKSEKNSFEQNFIPTIVPNNGGSTKYNVDVGDADLENNTEFQYPGYLYCDGSEYNISDYPALYSVIGNVYGGTPIPGITEDNVWENWPGNLGTFKVPDFKAKRLVGNGAVYGNGTPSVGDSGLGVGPSTIDGKWYLDEDGQKGRFTLGNVTTTGYELVTDSIPAQVVGTQTITVALEEKRLNGPPQHSHFLLHSEASQDVGQPRKGSGDFYIRGYKNTNGKVVNYTAPGGLALTHKHILSKRAFTDTTIGTYDIYNYTAGDSGSGTIKEEGFYFASGGAGAGSFETQTFVSPPVFKKLLSTSLIGERTTIIEGTPIYDFTTTVYSSPGTYTFSMPVSWDIITIAVAGGAGSGGVGTSSGNSGSTSSASITGGLLSMTSTGGGGGGASNGSTGGAAGAAGSTSYSGTLLSSAALTAGNSINESNGVNATAGVGSKIFVAQIAGWSPSSGASLPSGSYTVGQGGQANASGTLVKGSNGNFTFTSSQPSVGPTTYTSSQNVTVGFGAGGKLRSLTWTLRGARGGNNVGTASGGPGNVLSLSFTDSACVNFAGGSAFSLYVGAVGVVPTGGSASFGPGGNGGPPAGSGTSGAGGGGATSIALNANLIAGAGGGGGGGGKAGGGLDGQPGNSSTPGVQATSANLFGGQGKNGGAGGCNGGGGGGGGGGIDSNASGSAGGVGGVAGANNTSAGAGARGFSAYKTTFFNSPLSNSDSNTGAGSGTLSYQSEESFYTPPGGGGGQPKALTASIVKEAALAVGGASFSSISATVGLGGGGVTNSGSNSAGGGNGAVSIKIGTVIGYDGGQTIISVGDIIKNASAGVEIYTSGTGSGSAGGFRLPTHQVPIIVFEPVSGGTGAAATAIVSNEVVSGATLTFGGSGYQTLPNVRFLHGAGSGTVATTTKNASGVITGISILPGSSTPYTRYVKFSGSEKDRFIVLKAQDCTTVKRLTIKVARGNGINGGNLPENGGDELKLYFNTNGTDNFPQSGFLGTIVPLPTASEISSNYDGNGTGNEATKWYSYSVDLPEVAQVDGVQFKIVQERAVASSVNDNSDPESDQYGICDFIYENKAVTELVFVPTEGKISTSGDLLSYTVDGDPKAQYASGMAANDVTFTLTSSVPVLPSASIDPDINIPLLEPYFLVKHLIKAF
jgi:hypothetical protein